MKLVLTGAGGFLGTELLKQLAFQDDVEVLAVSSKANPVGADGFPEKRIAFVTPSGLLSDPDLMEGYDVLLNCAFPRNVDGEALARGLDFISALFHTSSERVNAVVNISSQSVYDEHRAEPATEEAAVCLESTYAVAKYATELMLEETCSGIPHTNIRLASLVGPGFDQRVVNKFVVAALKGEAIKVMDGGSLFGYLDVRDAASGIIALCRNINVPNMKRVYNLGPDSGYSLLQMANCVKEIVEETYGIEVVVEVPVLKPMSYPTSSLVDSSAFKGSFQWTCQYHMHDTVSAIVERMARGKDDTA